MIDSDLAQRIYLAILRGEEPDDLPFPLDAEMQRFWDSVSAEVAAKPDVVWEVPSEIPDVQVVRPQDSAG